MSNKRAEDVVIGKNHVPLGLRFSADATVRSPYHTASQPANNVRIDGIAALVGPRTRKIDAGIHATDE